MFEGFTKGELILSFVVLHKGDIEVSPPVLEWIYLWYINREGEVELLTPKGRFEWGHEVLGGQINLDDLWLSGNSHRTMVCAPPPGGSRYAL